MRVQLSQTAFQNMNPPRPRAGYRFLSDLESEGTARVLGRAGVEVNGAEPAEAPAG